MKKFFKTAGLLAAVVGMSVCGALLFLGNAAAPKTDTIEPLAVEIPLPTMFCPECGEGVVTYTNSATCTKPGTITYGACSVCGFEGRSESVDALGHNWGSYIQTTAPTCTETGVETATCTRCDATNERILNALGHDFIDYEQTIAPTCTMPGIKTATCLRCDATDSIQIAALGHDSAITIPAVDATCTETGLTTGYRCSRCNAITVAQEEVPALGHDFITYEETISPTCTMPGTKTATCLRCDATDTIPIAALGHDSAITIPAVDATCMETGLTTGYRCSRCNTITVAQEEVPALGHDFITYEETISPTCTMPGVSTATCSRCGEEDSIPIAALGHNSAITIPAVEATCTETGLSVGYKCSRCGTITVSQKETLPLGHDFGVHEETIAPTCTMPGVSTATCSRCGEEDTIPIAALGHRYVQHNARAATCTEIGWNAYVTCSRCNYTTYEEIPATGHTFGPDATCTEDQTCLVCGEVVSAATGHIPGPAATCTTAQTCSVCGTQIAPALGHDEIQHEAKAATCTEIGWNAYVTCSRCNYTTFEEIPATGHTPGPAATCTTAQTCTVCGTQLAAALGHAPGAEATCTTPQVCTRCNAELAPALGHAPGAEATCTTAQTCTRCGTELAPALGHDLEEHEAKAATCTENGWDAYVTCSRCDYTTFKEIETRGHDWTEWNDTRESCDVAGERTRTCTVCGEEETEILEAGMHSWDEGIETKPATCAESGILTKTCTICGETMEETIEPLGHELTYHPAVDATETAGGNVEYWQCDACEAYFADAEGKIQITEEDTRIPSIGADVEDPEDPEEEEPVKDEGGILWWHWVIIVCVVIVLVTAFAAYFIAKNRSSRVRKAKKR